MLTALAIFLWICVILIIGIILRFLQTFLRITCMGFFYGRGWLAVEYKTPSKKKSKKFNWNKELKVVLVKKKWKNSTRKHLWTFIFTHLGIFEVQSDLIRHYLRNARLRIRRRYIKTYGKDTTLIAKEGNKRWTNHKKKRHQRRK